MNIFNNNFEILKYNFIQKKKFYEKNSIIKFKRKLLFFKNIYSRFTNLMYLTLIFMFI